MSASRFRARVLFAGALTLLLIAGAFAGPTFAHRDKPRGASHHPGAHRVLIIGHRGSAGYRPEHTLAAYELGARMGADYVEPDLVTTKDHVLVARHEPNITDTTDVASHPEFADRKTTKVIDAGTPPQTGWFTDDFTLAELKTLRAKERLPDVRQRNTIYNGRYQVPTFQEVIDLVKRLSRELHRDIGIYPETKHPTYFRNEGLPLEESLVATLNRNGLNRRGAKVFVQSFEVNNLKALNKVLRVPLVQLLDSPNLSPADGSGKTYGQIATAEGLKAVAEYADGVGPFKDYIIPRDASGHSLAPTSFVADAHAAGLVVHPYTFRNENQFLPLEDRSSTDPNAYGNAFAEDERFFKAGVDGIFTDNPDTGVAARNEAGF
jgi:glycerophosphoryl diester phosphodiesterase